MNCEEEAILIQSKGKREEFKLWLFPICMDMLMDLLKPLFIRYVCYFLTDTKELLSRLTLYSYISKVEDKAKWKNLFVHISKQLVSTIVPLLQRGC